MKVLNTGVIDPSWYDIFNVAFATLDPVYIQSLQEDSNWLPGAEKIFNAFSLPLTKLNFILFGESPYPRSASANGYAFWDANVEELWSEQGLSKSVNRATSLRNIIKMLLLARGSLNEDNTSQAAIAKIDKTNLIKKGNDLFNAFLSRGILLLNTSLVLKESSLCTEVNAWLPFIESILQGVAIERSDLTLILFGKVAQLINTLPISQSFNRIYAEHPYNISFIHNPHVLNFFRPLDLLSS